MRATDSAAIVLIWISVGFAAFYLNLPSTFVYLAFGMAMLMSFLIIVMSRGTGSADIG